jgi:hypothetical protein
MNVVLKNLQNILKSNKKLVRIIQNIKRRVNYFFSILTRNGVNRIDSNNAELIAGNSDKEHLFGYYNTSPWSNSGKYILALAVDNAKRHPVNNEKAEIGIFDVENDFNFIKLCCTKTWNLQQGCMLQWLGPDNESKIIYNDIVDQNYASIIFNFASRTFAVLGRPVYCVSRDGSKALSLNFSRLHRLRPGYGYSNLLDKTSDELAPSDDGIWILDLLKNHSDLLLSLKEISEINHVSSMRQGHHWFNHLEINPDGTRFSFLHRWKSNNKIISRLYTADMDGKEIHCLADEQMVSHYCWKNSRQILSWARINGGNHYFLIDDMSGKYEIIGKDILNEDGHPSFSLDERYILTDTYPDKSRMRKLLIYDTVCKKIYELGRYFSPFIYDFENRCDLHPRWSRDNKMICFDSTHEGKRQMYIIDNPIF